MAKKGRFTLLKRIVLLFFMFLSAAVGIAVYYAYKTIYQPNVVVQSGETYFYIKTGYTFTDVVNALYEQGIIQNRNTFSWVAERKKYHTAVKPGKYRLKQGMSNNELINLLRSGEQEPVKVTFITTRTKEQLAGKVARNIEADSLGILTRLNDADFCRQYGMNTTSIITLFLPNTYEFYWNTSADEFIVRMASEYKKFWNEERIQLARAIGLSQTQVATLASIVQAEQSIHRSEWPRVAGLYLNRLRIGMPLQSDPTLIYALGDFTIKRVLNKDKEINSPYNTYKNLGLPPGPILLPETKAIDAVLKYEKHDYLYMCAKEDFSGYHNFSKTLSQHNIYAQRYREALNKRNIMR